LEGTKPIPTFDETKADLRSKVLRDSRAELSAQAIIEKIKNEYSYTTFPKNLLIFQTSCDKSLLSEEWNSESVSTLNLPLFKLGDTILTTNEFVDYIQSQLTTEKPNESPTVSTETVETTTAKYFETWSDKTCLAYEDCRLEKKYPAFQLTLNEYRDGILLYEVIEKEIWGRSTSDSIGLEKYFEQNQDKYVWGDRRDFSRLHASGFKTAKEAEKAKSAIVKMLNKRKSEEEIKAAFSKNDTPIEIKITNGKVEKGIIAEMDALWHEKTPHTIAKVMPDNYNVEILRINNCMCPGPKQLNETRGLAIIDYQEYLEKMWVEMLQKKYPVKIDAEVLKSIKK
jgi:peptidyl-prolyl cis-trans isomerase SurA